ncbi:PIN domain nuclease [bacterium]|nr:PIN domain nuclease [bacterium]
MSIHQFGLIISDQVVKQVSWIILLIIILFFKNNLVLTELVPFLRLQHQTSIIQVINEVANLPLSVDWSEIQDFQYTCLKSDINGVGIPDLIIVQNARQSDSFIFSLDKHFALMRGVLDFELYL